MGRATANKLAHGWTPTSAGATPGGGGKRRAFTLAKVSPFSANVASAPANDCQRWTATSTYFGSSSTTRARRPSRSAATIVVPDPPNGSRTISRLFDELRSARSTSATGFIVGCKSLRLGPNDEGRPSAAGIAECALQRVQLRRRHAHVGCPLRHREDVGVRGTQHRLELLSRTIVQDWPMLAPHLVFWRVGGVHAIRRVGKGHVGEFTGEHLLDIGS